METAAPVWLPRTFEKDCYQPWPHMGFKMSPYGLLFSVKMKGQREKGQHCWRLASPPPGGQLSVEALRSFKVSLDGYMSWSVANELRAFWADSAVSLGLNVPVLADSSIFTKGIAASSTYRYKWARFLSTAFAAGVILDWMVGSILGALVNWVSGRGCFHLMVFLFLEGTAIQ